MRRSARSTGVLLALGGLVMSGVLVTPAHAAPDLEQVRMKVMDLESKAESATERFNESRNELQEVRRDSEHGRHLLCDGRVLHFRPLDARRCVHLRGEVEVAEE